MKNLDFGGDFGGKNNTRKCYVADVTIRLNKGSMLANGGNREAVVFRFYNDAWRKIVNKGEHMVFAYDEKDNRIYYKEASAIDGYKLVRNGKSNITSVTKTISNREWWIPHIGDYVLSYDKEEKLYYIDLNKKK